MKKSKYLLIVMLLLVPTIVFASNGSGDEFSLTQAVGLEVINSFLISLFILDPLSKIISQNNSKKVFWILFAIRVIILLFFDLFITTEIVMLEFFVMIIGEPIFSSITKKQKITTGTVGNQSSTVPPTNVILKCTKCGNVLKATDKVCAKCKTPFEGDNVKVVQDTSPVVKMDKRYLVNEKIILKNMILNEIKTQGENEKNLSIKSLNIKKNILLGLVGLLTFICVLMFYFNYSLTLCWVIEAIGLLIYFLISKRFNIVNVLMRQAIKKPDIDISNIVKEIADQKHNTILPSNAKLIIVVLTLIILPSLFFMTPKILYQRFGDGYYVLRYTRGLIQQEENEVVIPTKHRNKPVLGIQENAFKNSSVEKITLPDGLQSIKTKAFYNCKNIEEITIPSTVTEIRASAFENNTGLVTVNLSEGLTEIRASAFKNCVNLVNIKLPDSLEYLGASAFSHCSSLTEITIPKKVIEINGQTFEYCTSLEKINLHDDIISIHGEIFVGDVKLDNVILPSKITEIRGNTFEECTSLTSITIPDSVTRIGGHAFYGNSSLNTVTFTENSQLKEIGSSAFRLCPRLKQIVLPKYVNINERAFKESPTELYYFGEKNYGILIDETKYKHKIFYFIKNNEVQNMAKYYPDSVVYNHKLSLEKVDSSNQFSSVFYMSYDDGKNIRKFILDKENPLIVLNDDLAIEISAKYVFNDSDSVSLNVYYN